MVSDDKSGGSSNNISIQDAIKMQDNLRKDIDFDKPESELTPEEAVKRAFYFALDKSVEESMGKDAKRDLDEKRNLFLALSKFQENLNKLAEIGREVEKNFIWQSAYLINHFDKSKENNFRLVVDGMTTDLVDKGKPMSNHERVEFAKKLLEILRVYRNEVIKELTKKQEIISALIPSLERTLGEINFDLYGKEIGAKESADKMKYQFQEWLKLSKELFNYRSKAISAVEEHLDIDELLPKYVIENNGDITKNLSAIEMKSKGGRMVKLINEADKAEKEIGERRSVLSEELFGKAEDYMELSNNTENKSQPQQTIQNPLQIKPWFRFAKVVYIGAYALSLLIGLAIISEDGTSGFWWIVGTMIVFSLIIKRVFYYVVLGKTNWK